MIKKWIVGVALITSAFTMVGWGSPNGDRKYDRDKGYAHADRDRQASDEEVKRAQGDEAGARDARNLGPLQNDERGRW